VNSNGGPVKVRYRHDLDSKDARSILEENFHPEKNTSYGSLKASVHVTPDEKILGAAGKASRMVNDYNAGPFTWVDVDTEEERRLAEFNAGSQAVAEVLEGDGYLVRDTDPKAKLIPDEYAAVKGRKVSPAVAAEYKAMKFLVMGDSIAKQNILQPDLNFAAIDRDGDGVIEQDELDAAGGMQGEQWIDADSEFEKFMEQKNFGQPKPYGTDPLDAWYGKPDYPTSKKADVDQHQKTLAAARERHRTYVPPSATPGGIRKSAFEPAWHVSEADGKTRQHKVHQGIHKTAPFGVDEPDFSMKYETSSLAGPGSWDQSMASRIARRRLTGRQPKSPSATGSDDAVEAGLLKLRANVGNM